MRLAIREAWCSLIALATGRGIMYWYGPLKLATPTKRVVVNVWPDEIDEALAAFLLVGMREEYLIMRELHKRYVDALTGAM